MADKIIKLDLTLTQTYYLYVLDSQTITSNINLVIRIF